MLFEREVGVQVRLRGLDLFVAEPEREHRGVDPGVQEPHRGGVTHSLPTGCGLYPCRDNSAANPATNGPSGPGAPTPDASAIRAVSSLAINTSETISAKPLRLCTPHPGPTTLSAGTS